MSTPILFSVIIPTHNRSSELRRAVESVLKQSEQSFEVLVMDDASTENLGEVVSFFNDERIKSIRNDVKTNANVMRNMGIRNATGEFVAFLDSDDEWLPEHLSTKLAILQHPKAAGVYGSSFIDDGESLRYAGSKHFDPTRPTADFLLGDGFAPIPSWVLKRSAALDVMFDESLHRHQDYDFFVRFAEKYEWVASWEPTIVIHWTIGAARTRHAGSEIQFVQRNFGKISPKIYFHYHITQLHYYREAGAEAEILDYYKRETLRFAHNFTFMDYCSVFAKRRGIIGFFRNWLGFSGLILKRKLSRLGPPVLPTLK